MSTLNPKTWKSICLLRDARVKAKARVDDLVRTRKVLDQDLDHLGAGNTQSHLLKSRQMVLCLREIDYQRDQQKQLADRIDEAVLAGINGDVVEIDPKTLETYVDEASLFSGDTAEEEDEETPPLPGISANKRMDAETDAFKIPASAESSDEKPRSDEKAGGPVAKVGKKSKKAAKA